MFSERRGGSAFRGVSKKVRIKVEIDGNEGGKPGDCSCCYKSHPFKCSVIWMTKIFRISLSLALSLSTLPISSSPCMSHLHT